MKSVIAEARNERSTIGLDLGCVVDGSGAIVSEHKVRTTADGAAERSLMWPIH
jgi:hypothetical protein